MSDILNIAALSLDILQGEPEENLRRTERLMKELPLSPDLVVLPELFTTGFIQDAGELSRVAESIDGSTMKTVAQLARQYDTAICGSFAAKESGKIYNRAFFVKPVGDAVFYDKRHLFCLSSEAQLFGQGRSPMPIVDYRGWRIAMMICYDLRFPVWSRNCGNAYDMLVVPANWPHARGYAWTHLLIARAIENQAVVVGANRSGSDDYGCYDNLSFIYDALGESIGAELPDIPVTLASPSLEAVAKVRRRMPAHRSADHFSIEL